MLFRKSFNVTLYIKIAEIFFKRKIKCDYFSKAFSIIANIKLTYMPSIKSFQTISCEFWNLSPLFFKRKVI